MSSTLNRKYTSYFTTTFKYCSVCGFFKEDNCERVVWLQAFYYEIIQAGNTETDWGNRQVNFHVTKTQKVTDNAKLTQATTQASNSNKHRQNDGTQANIRHKRET